MNSNPGNCISVDSGCIGSGEFVLHSSHGAAADNAKQQLGSLQPAQVIAIADRHDIATNEKSICMEEAGNGTDRLVLMRHFEVVSVANSSSRPDHVACCHAPETLLEVKATSEVQWIALHLVKSIAFVFHLDAIQEGRCNCSSIRNTFFTHTQIDEEGKEFPVSEEAFKPFHCPCGAIGESFSERIWNGVTASQELTFRALSSKGNWDGRNKHAHMVGSNHELFECLVMSVRRIGGGTLTEKECSSREERRD